MTEPEEPTPAQALRIILDQARAESPPGDACTVPLGLAELAHQALTLMDHTPLRTGPEGPAQRVAMFLEQWSDYFADSLWLPPHGDQPHRVPLTREDLELLCMQARTVLPGSLIVWKLSPGHNTPLAQDAAVAHFMDTVAAACGHRDFAVLTVESWADASVLDSAEMAKLGWFRRPF